MWERVARETGEEVDGVYMGNGRGEFVYWGREGGEGEAEGCVRACVCVCVCMYDAWCFIYSFFFSFPFKAIFFCFLLPHVLFLRSLSLEVRSLCVCVCILSFSLSSARVCITLCHSSLSSHIFRRLSIYFSSFSHSLFRFSSSFFLIVRP